MWEESEDENNSKIAKKEGKKCYRNSFFRESIKYIRKNGSVDEKIETYLMGYYRHRLFKLVLKVLKIVKS